MANILAYYNVAIIMAVKSFIVQALVAKIVISLSMLLVVLMKVDIYGN